MICELLNECMWLHTLVILVHVPVVIKGQAFLGLHKEYMNLHLVFEVHDIRCRLEETLMVYSCFRENHFLVNLAIINLVTYIHRCICMPSCMCSYNNN